MKVYQNVIQKSPEWDALRLGVPTASAFSRIVTPSGGKSQSREKYMHELLAERLTGKSRDEYKSWEMERGSALEHEAHAYFSLMTDLEAVNVGIVTSDDGRWGASPDSFVGDKQTLEIKCPDLPQHVGHVLHHGAVYKEHILQVQGQLWVCEREEAWVLSYSPDVPMELMMALEKVGRDDKLIKAIAEGVKAFSDQLEELYFKLTKKSWAAPLPEGGSNKGQAEAHDVLLQQLRESLIATQRNA